MEIVDTFDSTIEAFQSNITFESTAIAITDVDNAFQTKMSGYLGFSPHYALDEDDYENNFLYNLK